MMASENELRGVARLARESVVVANAVTLARWIGTGRRPVTAAQVLRKADIPAAGAAPRGGGAPRARPVGGNPGPPPPRRGAGAAGPPPGGGGRGAGGPAPGDWPP